jgi:hypothetical protein
MGEVLPELDRNVASHIEVVAAFGAAGEATVDADAQSIGVEERRP